MFVCSCAFEGTREQLAEHLDQCKFEGLKGFLSRTDDLIHDLQEELKRKDDDITFLRSMLASLSEKVDQYEKSTSDKIGMSYGIHTYVGFLNVALQLSNNQVQMARQQ